MRATTPPTEKQRRKIASWKFPVPKTKEEAKTLIRYVLNEPPAEINERVREIQAIAITWIGKRVCVIGKKTYEGSVIRFYIRSKAERSAIAQKYQCNPSLFMAIVLDDDEEEHSVSLRKIRVIVPALSQKLLF